MAGSVCKLGGSCTGTRWPKSGTCSASTGEVMPIVFASRAARLASALLPLYEMRSLAWTLGNVLAKDSGDGKDPTCTQNEEDWSTRRRAMVVITFVAPNRTRKISEIKRGLVADFAVRQSDRRDPPALPQATFRLKGRLRGREPSAWS